jgi:DNA-binding LacI/PurR family transcriptional regulator
MGQHKGRDGSAADTGQLADPPRPPTSADVARRAKVGRTTVSYVLNDVPDSRISEETCERVRQAAEQLGYVPHMMARSLRAGRNKLVIIPNGALPRGPLLNEFYDRLEGCLADLGYTVIFHGDRKAAGVEGARLWAALRPIALIVQADRLSQSGIAALHNAGVRAILAYGSASSSLVPCLSLGGSLAGVRAAEYLVAQGHTHLGVVVPREPELLRLGLARLKGVEQICHTQGVRVDRLDLAYDLADAQQLIRQWQRGTQPTGLFTYNDEYAFLLLQALRGAGWTVPQDIALVGCDDLPLCRMLTPQLTSVHLAVDEAVHSAAALMDALVQGRDTALPALLPARTTIIVRESS